MPFLFCREKEDKMREKQKQPVSFQPDRILSYFKAEWQVLLAVTISGLIYNVGLLAGPWFEGKMTGCLVDILRGAGQFGDMLILVLSYVAVIVIVQSSRYIKRFYVRRFANNVNRRMKEILYGSLVRKSRASLKEEGEGNVITKAILDVDDCVEGMRKFTTEIFDTGVALAAYAGMLLWYDWRLALLCMLFPPISYMTAEKMKKMIQRTGAAYKEQSGALSAATLDRAENAITYRVFGREKERQNAYEENLSAYEKSAVRANIWEHGNATGVSRHLHGRCAVHFVFRTEKYIGNRLACMGHCGVYHIFVVLCETFREVVKRCEAVQCGT
jgi:hypothetical protein